jgi:predicted phosphodiesterase
VRVALLSDVHGNLAALEAVLADAEAAGADTYWVLGDLVAYGPRPAEVVDRVRRLPGVRCVRGNTDRYVLTGDVSGMWPAADDPALRADVLGSLAWTRRAVVDAGQEPWLASRPLEERADLPDGTRALIVHASPGRDDGAGAQPDADAAVYADLGFTRDSAGLVLVGHTHVALDRHVNGTHVVNPGPVSLPPSRDGVARWALLTATEEEYDVRLCRAAYDREEVVADLHRIGHPAAGWIAEKLGAGGVPDRSVR